ncbi:inositol monophosphatase [Xaviernesmea oryzae]|uniref:Inositol monophosphatase n=1 Tax=Xaviernesmea oryzae TaxID=464029 RepID=A0A1Q9AWV5_9HYPH|nr:inositol monophosphatase family protein [Xaviernesmea oryzae]OLP59914.1 inositol monophosphatase [Xaviernesmea oryzae]SEK45498.1 fructose-1,6-bisphosphatase [Xaviernesmea oryzae]
MTTEIDIAALAALLQEAANAEILPRFRNLGAGDIRAKSEAIDLVTEADEAAERLIKARMETILPGALFVGEESTAADPSLLQKLGEADLAVIVDPIDGTYNYAAGMPLFGVMASVVAKGQTVAGIIYDPLGNDWVIAEKGSGAWMCKPDGSQEKLAVSPAPALEDMVGCASTGFYPPETRALIMGKMAQVRVAASYRCAAHEYRTLAAGFLHFLMYQKLMPWDHLAGCLIAEEAGAYVARFDGAPYRPTDLAGGLLVASDRQAWTELREKVFVA